MGKISVKVVLYLSMFFMTLCYDVATGQEKEMNDCYNGDNAPFGADNLRMASKDIEFIDSAESRASSFHYQREFAYEAIINSRSNNDKINLQDLLLIKDCPNLDKEYPTMIQLHGCMETLHDKMEDELAIRFRTIKMWEKKCESLLGLKCKTKIDKYSEDLAEDYEIEENSVCLICSKVNKPIKACRKGL